MTDAQNLISAFLDQTITDEQFRALNDWLAADPANARHFASMLVVHCGVYDWVNDEAQVGKLAGMIQEADPDSDDWLAALTSLDHDAACEVVELADAPHGAKPGRKRPLDRRVASQGYTPQRVLVIPKALVWVGIAAACALGLWLLITGEEGQPADDPTADLAERATEEPAETTGTARIIDTINAIWEPGYGPVQEADDAHRIDGQELHLRSGLVQVETEYGVLVVVEGPARFQVASPSRLSLATGRLTAHVPDGAEGFTVQTPDSLIIDQGTEFGVEYADSGGTHAQVINGEITFAPHEQTTTEGVISKPILLTEGQALSYVPDAGRALYVAFDEKRYITNNTFNALAGKASEEDRSRSIRWIWERNPNLFAAESFGTDGQDLSYGWAQPPRVTGDARTIPNASDARATPTNDAFGGRLVFESAELATQIATLFYDVDLSRGGPADRAGLIDPDTGKIGRDGTRVCLAWTMQLDEGAAPDFGHVGLSLFADGDDQPTSERCFFGQRSSVVGLLGIEIKRPGQATELAGSFNYPAPVELGRDYRWLVVIDYLQDGQANIAVYLDPGVPFDPGSAEPDFEMISDNSRFDRVRIEAGHWGASASCTWSFDEIRLGTTIESVY